MFGRRKVTLGDFATGALASLRNGTIMDPFATVRQQHLAHDRRVAKLGQTVVAAATNDAVGKWLERVNRTQREVQYTTKDASVKVSSGWSRKLRQPTTNIVVEPRSGNTGEHLHAVIDQASNVIHEDWADNH